MRKRILKADFSSRLKSGFKSRKFLLYQLVFISVQPLDTGHARRGFIKNPAYRYKQSREEEKNGERKTNGAGKEV